MYYVLRIAGAANIILTDFNLAVSTPTAKPPNLNPRQIFRLYGTILRIKSLRVLSAPSCTPALCFCVTREYKAGEGVLSYSRLTNLMSGSSLEGKAFQEATKLLTLRLSTSSKFAAQNLGLVAK